MVIKLSSTLTHSFRIGALPQNTFEYHIQHSLSCMYSIPHTQCVCLLRWCLSNVVQNQKYQVHSENWYKNQWFDNLACQPLLNIDWLFFKIFIKWKANNIRILETIQLCSNYLHKIGMNENVFTLKKETNKQKIYRRHYYWCIEHRWSSASCK